MSVVYHAMRYAYHAHRHQLDRYTKLPYIRHPAMVAAHVGAFLPKFHPAIAVGWLHDTLEDTDATYQGLKDMFSAVVADGVQMLTDTEKGDRATRKRLSNERLAAATGWVQTVKVCDIMANLSGMDLMTKDDPKFAALYLHEKADQLAVLMLADSRAIRMACDQIAFLRLNPTEPTHATTVDIIRASDPNRVG